jgi:hypothetical protein
MSDITKLKLSDAPHLTSINVAISSDYLLLIDSSDQGKVKRVTADELIWATKIQEMVQKNLRNCGIIIDDNDPISTDELVFLAEAQAIENKVLKNCTILTGGISTDLDDIVEEHKGMYEDNKHYYLGTDIRDLSTTEAIKVEDILTLAGIDKTAYEAAIHGFQAYAMKEISTGKYQRKECVITLTEADKPYQIFAEESYAAATGYYLVEFIIKAKA